MESGQTRDVLGSRGHDIDRGVSCGYRWGEDGLGVCVGAEGVTGGVWLREKSRFTLWVFFRRVCGVVWESRKAIGIRKRVSILIDSRYPPSPSKDRS